MFSAELLSLELKTPEQQLQYIQRYQEGQESNIYLYGKLLMQNHQYDKAREVLVKQLNSEPNRVNSLLCLSDIYRLERNPEQAMALLKKASQIDPKYDTTHYKIIKLLLEQGRLPEAQEIFKEKESIFTKFDPEYFLTKARLQIEEGLLDSARESLNLSIKAINVPYETPFILNSIIALKKKEEGAVQRELLRAVKHTGFRRPKIREKLESTIVHLPMLSESKIYQAIKDILSLDISTNI